MFDDPRSRSVIFVAHCILNQNAVSGGTATCAGCVDEVVSLLSSSGVGIVQMPCPELNCLGLSRGATGEDPAPVLEENTRIREELSGEVPAEKMRTLATGVVFQIMEYLGNGFDVKGVTGINRSPSCGVETTTIDGGEVAGEGLFVEMLRRELGDRGIEIPFAGIKTFETDEAVETVRSLISGPSDYSGT